MNRFQSFIKRIGGEDKVLHFETCCLITMVVALLNMNVLGLGIAASAVLAYMIAIISGILKEVYDNNTYGLFDNKDLVADALGAFVGYFNWIDYDIKRSKENIEEGRFHLEFGVESNKPDWRDKRV